MSGKHDLSTPDGGLQPCGMAGWPSPPQRPKLARWTWVDGGVRYSIWYDPEVGLPPGWEGRLPAGAERVEP